MNKPVRAPHVGDQYSDELGTAVIVATAQGFAMCRRENEVPFVLSFEEWRERYALYRSELLHPSRVLVLRLLQQEGPKSMREICAAVGLSMSAVRKHVYGLRDARKKQAYVCSWATPEGSGGHTPMWAAGDKPCKRAPKPLTKYEYQRRYRLKKVAIRRAKQRKTPFHPYAQLIAA